jgi:hypothetical protein
MRKPLRYRSREEQKAFFSMHSRSKSSESFSTFNKRMDVEFKEDIPHGLKDIILTDKNIKMKHTFFGADRPLDEFWFEADKKKNRFSEDNDDDGFYEYDVTSGTGVGLFSERA